MILVSDGTALTGLYLEGQKHFPKNADAWVWGAELPLFEQARVQLGEYFAGERRCFDLPLQPKGTPFQQRVWRELEGIPHGATLPYAEVARRVGKPTAARAVGAAVGRNPLTILVPCHRVVGQNGSLTGFAGGLDRKERLLNLESSHPSRPDWSLE
jgi:methylated-DNA-[protein]-cysteine S-methyltransferase